MLTDRFPATVRTILAARRKARFCRFMSLVQTWDEMNVLDVGCGVDGRSFSDAADPTWNITGIDLHEPEQVRHTHPRFTYRKMDARDLSAFADREFDLVVSIGMLEHITDPDDYAKVCSEMQRVAKQIAVTVPYKWAWIEPHYGFPFFGALPRPVQRGLIQTLNLSGHRNHLDYFDKHFRWRSNAEYSRDFPGSTIHVMPTLDTITIVSRAT